jgi:short-subunit dehydrogenase
MAKRVPVDLRGRTALVTGASSGLGVDFARQLAARGCNLILVARREDRLRAVAEALTRDYGVCADAIVLDLSARDEAETLFAAVGALGRSVDVLINNAGFGVHDDFLAVPWARQHEMIELDVTTVVHLTHLCAAEMVQRRFGYILNVASIAAFQPSPGYATYAAAKAFVMSFSQALDYELRDTGVSCTVTSPGVTATEFLEVAGQQQTFFTRLTMMESADVVRISLAALFARRRSVVPGRINALLTWFSPRVPTRLAMAVAHLTMRNDSV